VILFQVQPPHSLTVPLAELNLDINSMNQYLFSRLHERYVDRRARREERMLRQQQQPERLAASNSSRIRAASPALPAGGSEHNLSSLHGASQVGQLTAPASPVRRFSERVVSTPTVPAVAVASALLSQADETDVAVLDTLPFSQVMYDSRIAFLYHPLASRTRLGTCMQYAVLIALLAAKLGLHL